MNQISSMDKRLAIKRTLVTGSSTADMHNAVHPSFQDMVDHDCECT
jgi:hypothetical protein